ncbi:MAG: MFS transporter [Candidatus Bathyarchaeia archaeon]
MSHLYATIFLTSTSYGAIVFLIPVYAEGLGASYIDLGFIGAAGSMVYAVMTVVSGFLLDRFERVRLYLVFNTIGVVIVALFSFTSTVFQVILLRGVLGIVSAAFWVTASTLTADLSPAETLTQSVSRYNIAWITGFIVGPFIGGFISDFLGFRALFLILSTVVILSVIINWVRLASKLTLYIQSEKARFEWTSIKHLVPAYIALFPFSIVLGIYMAILPAHMKSLGIASSTIGFLLTMTNGVRGLGFLNTERFVGWGATKSLSAAAFLLCGAFFAVAFSQTTFEFAAPLLMYGLAAGIITPVILDYIAHRTPRNVLGTAMGVHECVYGIGMSLGPVAGGAIAEAYSPATLFLVLVAMSSFIIPLSFGLRKVSLDTG